MLLPPTAAFHQRFLALRKGKRKVKCRRNHDRFARAAAHVFRVDVFACFGRMFAHISRRLLASAILLRMRVIPKYILKSQGLLHSEASCPVCERWPAA
jgi:hypothetical protein